MNWFKLDLIAIKIIIKIKSLFLRYFNKSFPRKFWLKNETKKELGSILKRNKKERRIDLKSRILLFCSIFPYIYPHFHKCYLMTLLFWFSIRKWEDRQFNSESIEIIIFEIKFLSQIKIDRRHSFIGTSGIIEIDWDEKKII